MVSGFDNGTFGAGKITTRSQAAKMVSRALGIADSDTTSTSFTDLGPADDDLFPQKYVAALSSVGAVQGTRPGQFSPYAPVTRAQILTMMVRALRTLDPGALTKPPSGFVATVDAFSPTFDESMAIAQYDGLLAGLAGYGPGWNPWAPASRGEAAQMLSNLAQLE